jgi:hypothetical protein
LFFVEANDEGQANEDQLNAVFETVEARGDAGVIVAVLVHGWQHSAKPGDSYVCRFAALIRSVEQMEETRAAGRARRDVVGVYVGWPGALYPEDLANGATTFWNRLEVADRLGADGAVLPRLIRGLGERLPGSRNGGADRSSALVVAGHSLGGRAVFAAVRSDVVDGADSRRPDLVLLMNPAFSADIYAEGHARRCAPGVPLLSFSSRTDGVTRRVYPAGQTLTYPYEADAAPAFIEHIYTAANYESYLTHRLRLEPVAGMPPEPEDEQTILRGPQRVPLAKRSELYDDTIVNVYAPPQGASDAVWYTMRLERADAAADCAPEAKVIEVDPRILPNHSDIFTPSFMEYAVRALNKSLGPRQ